MVGKFIFCSSSFGWVSNLDHDQNQLNVESTSKTQTSQNN